MKNEWSHQDEFTQRMMKALDSGGMEMSHRRISKSKAKSKALKKAKNK